MIIKEYFDEAKNKLWGMKFPLAVIVVYLAIFEIFFPDRTNCLVQNITGFPCPTCGMTRAYKSLLHLDIKGAFEWHPLFWLVPLVAVVMLLQNHRHFKKINMTYFSLGIFIPSILVYTYRMVQIFPNSEPLDYEWSSLLGSFIKMIIGLLG